jgi:hypothetical protein
MILLRFRYRIANEVADPLITDLLNLSFVALSTILLSKALFFPVNPMAAERVPAEPVSFFWSIVVSTLAALLVLYLFGIYRVEAEKP